MLFKLNSVMNTRYFNHTSLCFGSVAAFVSNCVDFVVLEFSDLYIFLWFTCFCRVLRFICTDFVDTYNLFLGSYLSKVLNLCLCLSLYANFEISDIC